MTFSTLEAARLYEPGADTVMATMLTADASLETANVRARTCDGFAEDDDVERAFRETRLGQVTRVSTNLVLSRSR